jgi:hypothetical protein
MKHLLNDLTEQEKNSIREQHTGGMKVVTENFSKLINAKSGNVKPLVNEQPDAMQATQPTIQPKSGEKQIAGPFTNDKIKPLSYYIFEKGGKFYIYQTNNSQKIPILFNGTLWSNNGQGYGTSTDAKNIINQQLNKNPNMGQVVNEQGEEEFLDRESKDRIIRNIVQGKPYKSTRVGSSSECEGLIQTMKFISNDYMESIKTLPDEFDEADALDFYDGFETELGGILDHANQMDCDDEIIQHLEILYNEYLSDMANKLGLR